MTGAVLIISYFLRSSFSHRSISYTQYTDEETACESLSNWLQIADFWAGTEVQFSLDQTEFHDASSSGVFCDLFVSIFLVLCS